MRCSFCATGMGGFARNLMAHEIVDQVLTVQQQFGTRVNNVGAGTFFGSPPPKKSRKNTIVTFWGLPACALHLCKAPLA